MEPTSTKYYTEITGEHKWFDLKLKEVWQYRDLIVLFTKRAFQRIIADRSGLCMEVLESVV